MTAIALPRQPHSEWMARIRTIGLALGGRGVMGLGLGRSSVGAAAVPWWLSGGVAAANCLAAYTPKGAGSLALSYDNNAAPGNGLADGTYDAALGVAPTFDAATGWTFDGATQYLKTGATPATDQSWTAIVRYSGQSGDNRILIGGSAGYEFEIRVQSASILARQNASAAFFTLSASNPGYGVACMAGCSTYFDGIAGATITASTGSTAAPLYIGQRRNYSDSPTAGVYFLGNILALAVYSATLTAPQVLAISNAMSLL